MSGKGIGFARIRRVTGYLAQDITKMNDGKQAEVNDRVKHANLKGDGINDKSKEHIVNSSKFNELQVK